MRDRDLYADTQIAKLTDDLRRAHQRIEWASAALHGDAMFGDGTFDPLAHDIMQLRADRDRAEIAYRNLQDDSVTINAGLRAENEQLRADINLMGRSNTAISKERDELRDKFARLPMLFAEDIRIPGALNEAFNRAIANLNEIDNLRAEIERLTHIGDGLLDALEQSDANGLAAYLGELRAALRGEEGR
jgi:hypothetical protein